MPKTGGPWTTTAYILGAEDQITVVVYKGLEFSGSHMIRPDGRSR